MLHGDISINNHVIGSWRAVNKGKDPEMPIGGVNLYHVTATYRDLQGYPMASEFMLHHRDTNGAMFLASRVLAEVEKHGRPVRPLDDESATVQAVAERVFR